MTPVDALLLIALVIATVTDVQKQHIYNWLTFPLMLAGLTMGLVLHGLPGLGAAALGLGAALVVHFGLFALGVDRAGDAKLMMGIGAMLGWEDMLEATMFSFIVFAPMGLVVLAMKGRLGNLWATLRYQLYKAKGVELAKPEPTYLAKAPAIFLATVLARWIELIYV